MPSAKGLANYRTFNICYNYYRMRKREMMPIHIQTCLINGRREAYFHDDQFQKRQPICFIFH